MRLSMSLVRLCLLGLLLAAGPALARADADRPSEHQQYATDLWNFIHSGSGYTSWKKVSAPIEREFAIPTTKTVKAYGKGVAEKEADGIPHGALIVTEQYDNDGKNVVAITAWYKREFGNDPRHNFWYWVSWLPDGTVLSTAGDAAPARRGFVVLKKDNDLWVFRPGDAELPACLKGTPPANVVSAEKGGPNGETLKGSSAATLQEYEFYCDELGVCMDKKRIWVFKIGSPEVLQYAKNGELAINVSRIGEGPKGITVKAPDAATADAYIKLAKAKVGAGAK